MKIPTYEDHLQFGQIRPGSPFGKMLTELAEQSETIVEIGTWRGLGSTYCLYLGLTRPTQRLYTVEMSKQQHQEAKDRYDDPRIAFIHGTLVKPSEVPPFTHSDPEHKKYYDFEVALNKSTPYVLDVIPEQIDLLLIDGGFWSADVEFSRLWRRSTVIALDDTNPLRDTKNVNTRRCLMAFGWQVLADRMDDRNGWAIFKRPPSLES